MAAITIPPKLRELMIGTPYEAPILELADAVGTVLGSNTMPFFPAYTDHGTEHVEQLLNASVHLIPDAVWNAGLLHDLDGAVLVGACLLHDLAMHIREPGFVELVDPETRFTPRPWRSSSSAATDESWPTLWDAFQREARHFGTSQLELPIWSRGSRRADSCVSDRLGPIWLGRGRSSSDRRVPPPLPPTLGARDSGTRPARHCSDGLPGVERNPAEPGRSHWGGSPFPRRAASCDGRVS